MNTTAPAPRTGMRQIGNPPRLPLRIAWHVALTSIRVRMSRSMVTVSSVVLAVAFLLTVLGENVVLRAVYADWHRQSASSRQVLALRETLNRPRPSLMMLRLAATRGDMLAAWLNTMVGHRPTIDPAIAATAIELVDWLSALSPSKSYSLLRNLTIEEWLLAFRSDKEVDELISNARELKGVRLDMPRERLAALAAGMPALAELLQDAGRAETKRLAQVVAAGGADAVLQRLHDGADVATLTAAGLPVDQLLPDLYAPDPDGEVTSGRANLIRQVVLDRARITTSKAVAQLNTMDPCLVTVDDVTWDALARQLETVSARAASPAHQIAKVAGLELASAVALLSDPARRSDALDVLNRAITSAELWSPAAWEGVTLDAESQTLSARVRLSEREQNRLGRLLLVQGLPGAFRPAPSGQPLELRALLDGGLDSDPRGPNLRRQLEKAADGVTLTALSTELAHRASLFDIESTFKGLGYEPEKASSKTFWLVVLSLLVCTVGIVNTMMMAVSERFREIATMKCLGATDGFVLKAFLLESSVVGSAGALLGAGIGFLLVLIQGSARFGGSFWSAFPGTELAAAAGGSLACGLVLAIFGALLPALKASLMHPVEAMRIDA